MSVTWAHNSDEWYRSYDNVIQYDGLFVRWKANYKEFLVSANHSATSSSTFTIQMLVPDVNAQAYKLCLVYRSPIVTNFSGGPYLRRRG